jgi:hypothetical protein
VVTGSSVVYQDNTPYYNGAPVATAEEYTGQAAGRAARGKAVKPGEQEEWQSCGVFAMVRPLRLCYEMPPGEAGQDHWYGLGVFP